MNLLLLPGNSPRNKPWIHEVATQLAPLFSRCFVHEYEHWDNGRDFISFNQELGLLGPRVKDFGDYAIFAKSVGSILALKGTFEHTFAPNACILVGIPLPFIKKFDVAMSDWLHACPVPLLIIQNRNDPAGSFEDVKAYVGAAQPTSPCQLVELPGSDHDYSNLPRLTQAIQNFIAGLPATTNQNVRP